MKDLHGTASAAVGATMDRCIALFEAIDKYPSWHPDVVREVNVLDRHDGHPSRVQTKLHLARGPLVKDFDLVMAVASDRTREVKLTKVRDNASGPELFDATWRVQDVGSGGSRIQLELLASLDVPRFLPVGGVGDAMAEGFVEAAARALAS